MSFSKDVSDSDQQVEKNMVGLKGNVSDFALDCTLIVYKTGLFIKLQPRKTYKRRDLHL